jgi:hypothetical protein
VSQPLFTSRVDWSTWAAHADTRVCEGCGRTFAPNHPRRRFCGEDDCPGRRPTQTPRRRRPSGRAQAAARAAGIQGLLGEVLVECSRPELADGTLDQLIKAAKLLVSVERAGYPAAVRRQAVIRLLAAGAARGIVLVPPTLDDDIDEPVDLAA